MSGLGIIAWIIIGLLAGWIAERVTNSRQGMVANLAVGLIGALVGGVLVDVLGGHQPYGFWANLVVAIIGAILFLWVWNAIRRR